MAFDSRNGSDRTLGQLVAEAMQDVTTIIRKEIQLARAEVAGSLAFAKKGLPLLVVAGVFALYALGMLLTAAAWGLQALGLATWAAFLIVGALLLVVAAVLALVGKSALGKINPKPERTVASVEETLTALRSAQASGKEHAKAVPASNSQVALEEHPRHR